MARESDSSPPVGRTMKAAHLAARTIPNDEIVKAGELVEARFAKGVSPSASARKALALLLHKAAGDAWKPERHCISKRELRGSHNGNERLRDVLDEIQRTLITVKTIAPDGKAGLETFPLLYGRVEHEGDDDKGLVWWSFHPLARKVMQFSDHFAALNKAALLAFESKYASTLYELGCLLARRNEPRWKGSVDDLREKMGVPLGKYRDWADVRRKVVEPACAEVNQLADFTVSPHVQTGPRNRVLAIELWFRLKDAPARATAEKEREASRIGRKARRKGAVETATPIAALLPSRPVLR